MLLILISIIYRLSFEIQSKDQHPYKLNQIGSATFFTLGSVGFFSSGIWGSSPSLDLLTMDEYNCHTIDARKCDQIRLASCQSLKLLLTTPSRCSWSVTFLWILPVLACALNADCSHPLRSKAGFHSVRCARSRYGRPAFYELYRQRTSPTSFSPD